MLFFIPASYRKKDVEGQIVLITGAGCGLGRLMALEFGKLGCKLVLWDINSDNIEMVAAELRQQEVEAHTYTCDVSNSESVYSVANKVKTEVGQVDILINNAGIISGRTILDCSDAMMKKTMDVNGTGIFWTIKAFLPDMLSRDHGHIVTIASVAGLVGVNRMADYCASKFADVGFHESLREELYALNKTGIQTTLICPFFINTGMFEGVKTNWLLPMLDQEYVASKSVEAVLTNQAMLCMPRTLYLIVSLKNLVPVKAAMMLADFIGINKFMEEFHGHTKRE